MSDRAMTPSEQDALLLDHDQRREHEELANKVTTRSPELEAEVESAVPLKAERPKAPEALRKKWAEQIERARRGRSE